MSQRLCWKCRDKLEDLLFTEDSPLLRKVWPFILENLACRHDEPKEKPKCWCEQDNGNLQVCKSSKWGETVWQKPNFCPICGRKL